MDADTGDDPQVTPAAGGDEHDAPDWGAWLRGRLERVASLEATPGEEQPGEQPPAREEHPDQQGEADPAPTLLAATAGPDPRVAEELASLRAAVGALASGVHPEVVQELASLRAAVAALPSGVHPEVVQELAAMRTAIDDLGEQIDGLTAAIVNQGRESGERLDERVANVIQRLDDATATLVEQQRTSRGAISEVLDGTSDAAATLRRLSSALEETPAGGVGNEVLEALSQVSAEVAAAGRASDAQAAELTVVGNQLGRMQEILDRLVTDRRGEELASGAGPMPPDATVVELDGAQTAAIADAVAAMLLGATPPPRSPVHEGPEPRPSPPPRRRRVSTSPAPLASQQPPAGEAPPQGRRRARSTPLRATPAAPPTTGDELQPRLSAARPPGPPR
ncbi:MAG: hypothetical protein M3P53_09680 [Actinomycetota bacterium]|jgi:hypothetical protein|nr:hypothetical protein [Actinomycetota bacterium]